MSAPVPATAELLLRGGQDYLSPRLLELAAEGAKLANRDEIAASSARTYKYLTRHFEAFADEHGLDPFHRNTILLYITDRHQNREKKATLRARLDAIRRLARNAGCDDPMLDPLVQQARRNALSDLAAEPRRVSPATVDVLGVLLQAAQTLAERRSARLSIRQRDLLAKRDRALLLFGFTTGRRGAEIASVRCDDLDRRPTGLLVKFRRSKTNKGDEVEIVGIPRRGGDACAVEALEAWMSAAGIEFGSVFITLARGHAPRVMRGEDIAQRLAEIAAEANLPGLWRSHSLRRGVVTSAEALNIARSRTRMLTSWKSDAMFTHYADHQEKIAASPIHEIFDEAEARGQL
jgi:integrase